MSAKARPGLRQFAGVEPAAGLPAAPIHLAIGMFDGVHLGHQAVIAAAVQSARRDGGLAAVLTFWPHPSAIFRPENPTRLIQPPEAKARVLEQLGVDVLITQPFEPGFAALAAVDFLPWLRRYLPRLAGIYVGENFRFGRGRAGDTALLVTVGREQGLAVFSAPRVNRDGQPISSTRIRAQLQAGDVTTANGLLGYNYFAIGTVRPGKRLGRTLGFPTLNLDWAPEAAPRFGVYAVQVTGGTSPLPGVANYGLRPTVEQAVRPRLETHLLGACPFDAGDALTVEWLRFLRPEKAFANVDELRLQIARDREATAAFFGG